MHRLTMPKNLMKASCGSCLPECVVKENEMLEPQIRKEVLINK